MKKKNKGGRPRLFKAGVVKVTVTMDKDLLERLDTWREGESRSAVVDKLVRGLIGEVEG